MKTPRTTKTTNIGKPYKVPKIIKTCTIGDRKYLLVKSRNKSPCNCGGCVFENAQCHVHYTRVSACMPGHIWIKEPEKPKRKVPSSLFPGLVVIGSLLMILLLIIFLR